MEKIKFHLPSFAGKYKLNLLLLRMLEDEPQRFYDNIEIGSVYGDFPVSLWNGGRYEPGRRSVDFMLKVIEDFNSRGVPIRYTFTNPLITEEHLNDKHCNFCLQIAHNGLNEVIVVSEILEKYIREKFPKYPVVSSTCKHIEDPEKLRSELNKDYKMVVLDYNLNNKFEMYNTFSQEEKSKCEFLCFEVCIPNCPKRHEHQINTGQNIINLVKHLETGCGFEPIPFECMNGVLHTIYDIQDYPTFISPEAIYQKYVPMGFRNFKLESRTTDTLVLLDFYCQYLVKPEYRDKTRIDMLMHLKRNGVYKLES